MHFCPAVSRDRVTRPHVMLSTSLKRRARHGRAQAMAAAATALALWLLSSIQLPGHGLESSLPLVRQSGAARDCPRPIQAAANGLGMRLPVLPDACAMRR